ncbi:type I-C CRISPR-associated protein Cas8c/Csd1 [Peptostreptococcus faecalis]|uniref:type I-C CRISPR-associated protein Cas8c/Csd1 n=1 Tax=Peptostreptococcus faecalis TaxID=2045015 RepID=UPI000C7A9F6D|nr:type I-C CRISPR-associated protein Cas8c/Csd1 [Peptostreptococcus faecalis]
MSLTSILLKTYENCEKNNLIDRSEEISYKTVLLPVYHSNKRSNGKNIFQIQLDKDGKAIGGEFLPSENEISGEVKFPNYIIFPVTRDSVIRTSNSTPHPLADEVQYLEPVKKDKKDLYINLLKSWLEYETYPEVKDFLNTVYKYVDSGKITQDMSKFISKGNRFEYDDKKQELEIFEEVKGKIKKTKYDLEKVIITFEIVGFKTYKNVSVTNYKDLHRSYISFQNYLNKNYPKEICNLTGENVFCSPKHRGPDLDSRPKIICGSHSETYYGRFDNVDNIVKIGFETSDKIHNVLKYLLENKKTSTRMSGSSDSSRLLTWFSNDVGNTRETNILSENFSFSKTESDEEHVTNVLDGDHTKNLLSKSKGFYKDLNNNDSVYIAILDKVSNGRLSIKYFYQGMQIEFYKNIDEWYRSFSWYFYDKNAEKEVFKSPNLYNLVDIVYGIESSGRVVMLDNKAKLKENLIASLIPCVVEGKKIPMGMVKQSFQNIRNRQKYKKTWSTVVSMSCAVLRKYNLDYKKREVTTLLDLEKTDRSYLYGRILAILEYMEEKSLGDSNISRLTNIDKLWNSYINAPAKTLKILMEKERPYWNRLKKNSTGIYINMQKEIQNCVDLLSKSDDENKNKPLDEEFIFGYYAQKKRFIY